MRFIPIEAVAVVVQCKSNNINNSNLKEWKDSIEKLQTNTQSITRIITKVVSGFLDASKEGILETEKVTQTATRPIRILCHLNNGEKNYNKPTQGLFDIVICADSSDKENPMLDIKFDDDKKELGEWYASLNHNNSKLHQYKKDYVNTNTLEDNHNVTNNPILSLIFQLNQLLMLINNPMLFPHQAYANMFEDAASQSSTFNQQP